MDHNIFSLISDAKTTKEAWDTLERSFGVSRSIEVENEGGSITTYLQRDEKFVESHCAQPQVEYDCDKFTEEVEKECINAHESHYAQLQVDENLMNLATKLADENLMNPTLELADEILVILATKLANENLMNSAAKLADDNMVNLAIELADENLVNLTTEFARTMKFPLEQSMLW